MMIVELLIEVLASRLAVLCNPSHVSHGSHGAFWLVGGQLLELIEDEVGTSRDDLSHTIMRNATLRSAGH